MMELDIENEYDEICKKILEDPSIRFAGLIDSNGKLVSGGFKEGVQIRLSEKQQQDVFLELAARVIKRKKFDDELGRVKYSASRRQDVVIMSFPIYDDVILVVAEPNINIDKMAYQIVGILGQPWYECVEK